MAQFENAMNWKRTVGSALRTKRDVVGPYSERYLLNPRNHGLARVAMTDKRHRLAKALGQGWLVYCVIAPIGVMFFAFFDNDSLLHSDDPYIIGNFFGCVAGVLAVVHTCVEQMTRQPRWAHWSSAVALIVWSGILLAVPGEGRHFARFLGIGSAVAGALAWPLFRHSYAKPVRIALSALGVLLLTMWLVITLRL